MNIDLNKILQHLSSQLKPYNEIKAFSSKPGIYAIGFIGADFPLGSTGKDSVIYIGKTEDSQKSRDANTHFTSGKSGSSTLRRSIGAILKEEFELIAVPRNNGKSSQAIKCYEFQGKGEQIVTDWMKHNLSLAFWEYKGPPDNIACIEKRLIKDRAPILNHTHNPHKNRELRKLRAICRDEARDNST